MVGPTVEARTTLFKSDAEMNFAAFKQGFLLGTERFTQLYMYVGKALSILRQKSREHAHFAIETQISTRVCESIPELRAQVANWDRPEAFCSLRGRKPCFSTQAT